MATKRYAAIYCRISDDREGRELGVARQRADLIALAKRLGIEVYRIYEDNDISASAKARKARPDYQQMLTDAKAGVVHVILAYTSSRLTRQIRENEDLIALAIAHGIRYEYVRSPSFDLNSADGREIARMLAVKDAGEAERISERVIRDVDRRADAGEFHGGPAPFGQVKQWHRVGRTLRVAGFKVDPERKAWIGDAADRVLNGELLYGICADWNAKGRRTDDGNLWLPRGLKRFLTNPSVIGRRRRNGQLMKAPWEPILDEDTYDRVCEILTDPGRRKSETNQRKYMLSGLLYCGRCGNRLTSTSEKRKDGASFECSQSKTGRAGCGKIRIVMDPLERYITAQVFTRLNTPELRKAVAAEQETAHTADKELRDAVRNDELALTKLEDEYDDGDLPEDRYKRRKARITARMEENVAKLDVITQSQRTSRLPSGDELRAVWDGNDNTWKRATLARIIERIEIGPHPINPETGRLFASAPPRRRGESEDAWRQRFDLARAKQFAIRVSITWRH